MKLPFDFGLIRTDVSREADEHNAELFGPTTLGIEVTSAGFAERCELGNIDPQHSGTYDSSAIEKSMTWGLPERGSKLVTIRPDKDSIGAMAVLTLRALGLQGRIDRKFVAWVGVVDRFGYAMAVEKYASLMPSRPEPLSALNAVAMNVGKLFHSLEDRVYAAMQIITARMTMEDVEDLARNYRLPSADYDITYLGGGLGFIVAPKRMHEARNWANKRCPVALVLDPEYQLEQGSQIRWTLVSKDPSFDRHGFQRAINEAEAEAQGVSTEQLARNNDTWGGPPNIVSSAKGVGRNTKLSQEQILALVRQHMGKGAAVAAA